MIVWRDAFFVNFKIHTFNFNFKLLKSIFPMHHQFLDTLFAWIVNFMEPKNLYMKWKLSMLRALMSMNVKFDLASPGKSTLPVSYLDEMGIIWILLAIWLYWKVQMKLVKHHFFAFSPPLRVFFKIWVNHWSDHNDLC